MEFKLNPDKLFKALYKYHRVTEDTHFECMFSDSLDKRHIIYISKDNPKIKIKHIDES